MGRGSRYVFHVAEQITFIVRMLVVAMFSKGHKFFDTLTVGMGHLFPPSWGLVGLVAARSTGTRRE